MKKLLGLVAAAFVVLTAPAAAHRLDEYLQATRVSIAADRVGFEIDITAGANIATEAFARIDTNHDGHVSNAEADAYARSVLDALRLELDDRLVPLTLTARQFPSFTEMSLGVGVIRLSASAEAPRGVGRHRVSYRNAYLPHESVYLANVLVPADDRLDVDDQRRDALQRSLTVDYRVAHGASRFQAIWSVAAMAVLGVMAMTRRLRSA